MADHSAEIARLRRLKRAGVKKVDFDGLEIEINHDLIDEALEELIADDDTETITRPRVSTIDLSGF